MKQQLQIEVTDLETRVAVLDDGRLLDLYIERSDEQSLVGNIYKGRVDRVLPGMQAAFIDIGQQRTGFLHARDIVVSSPVSAKSIETEKRSINQLLHEGQSILVQVTKDPVSEKGARLSTDISIAGRNLVYLPTAKTVAMSKKIDNDSEAKRLSQLVEIWVEDNKSEDMTGHFIVRTQAEGVSESQLQRDFQYLTRAWQQLQKLVRKAKPGELLHAELPLLLRAVRDSLDSDTQSILINCPKAFALAQQFAQNMVPETVNSLALYKDAKPLFSLHDVETQIHAALSPMVVLPSGANLMIEQTEAMITIDVNSGSNIGSSSIKKKGQDVAFDTNLEASVEIARQIRLRNLTGIIIIDFIDMQSLVHKKEVLQSLQAEADKDSARLKISEVSRLGLVELTRKRTALSWQQLICEPCPTCAGQGRVKSAETVCYEIFREIASSATRIQPSGFTVIAAPTVVEYLGESKSAYLTKLQSSLGCPIRLVSESHYLPSQFDLAIS